jgi:hypothetical protein
VKIASIAICISLVTSGFVQAPEAKAWGKSGHLTVCNFAYQTVSKKVRDEIKRLIKADGEYRSFNYGCLEEDSLPRPHPDDHFINFERTKLKVVDTTCHENESCILDGIKRDLATLSNRNLSDKDRAKALLGLGHWVGDIHQPLHISYADDRGGNKLLVSGECGSAQDSNLHSVWDKCLVEKGVMGKKLKPTWAGFTTSYRAVDRFRRKTTAAEKALWTTTEPFQWADESYQIARDPATLYCNIDAVTKSCDRPSADRIAISKTYIDQNKIIVERRLRQAGVRLAFLLEQALGQ